MAPSENTMLWLGGGGSIDMINGVWGARAMGRSSADAAIVSNWPGAAVGHLGGKEMTQCY